MSKAAANKSACENSRTNTEKVWETVLFEKIVESAVIGLTKNNLEQGENKTYPYVKMNNISRDNSFDFSSYVTVDATEAEITKYSLKNGDFLFNTRNSIELVGKSCLFRSDLSCTILFNNNIMRIRFNKDVDAKFVLYAFSFQDVTEQLNHLKSGTTNVAAIYYKDLKNLAIPLPPISEQQRIVAILDEAFAGIATAKANAEKNLQNARALFESYLNAIFTKRSHEYVMTTLDKISSNLDSKRVPITKSDRCSGEYPYYGASGIVDYVSDYIFEGNSLLVSEDGANLLARSTPIAFSVTGKYWVNNHAHILKFDSMATQRFVEFYLESIKLDDYITGTAQPKLNQKALNSIPIPIPKSIETLAKVVKNIELLQEETQRLKSIHQQKLMALDELKKSLLHQAFSGEL